MQEKFTVKNVKCGGCAANIRTGLGALAGVQQVEVDVATGTVVVDGEPLSRPELARKLGELGYPETASE
jgi:copper chaperone